MTLVLVLAAAVVSAAGLRPAGLIAAVTTGLAYDYFWTEPYYSFRIFEVQDTVTVLLLVLVGGAIEQLSWWASRQRALAARRLDYLSAVRQAAEPIAPETHVAALEAISDAIRTVLDADSCRPVLQDRLPATVLNGDGSLTRAGRIMDVDKDGLPTDDVVAIPVPSPDNRAAYFAVTAATHVARPRAEQRQVAALLAHLASQSLAQAAASTGVFHISLLSVKMTNDRLQMSRRAVDVWMSGLSAIRVLSDITWRSCRSCCSVGTPLSG